CPPLCDFWLAIGPPDDHKPNQTLQRPTLFGGRRILLQCGRARSSVMFSSFSARILSGSARRARFPDLECASSNEENAIPHSGLASPMGNSGFLIWAVLPNEKNRWGRARSRAEMVCCEALARVARPRSGKAISLSGFRISRREKRFPSRHFAFPDRKSEFPLGISHFPTGKSDFPLGISHFPISKSDFLIAGVARLGKVGNRWHPSFNGAARDRARKAAEPSHDRRGVTSFNGAAGLA